MKATKKYSAAGVTTAQNGFTDRKMLLPLAIVSRLRIVPQRLEIWPGTDVWDELLSKKWKKKLLESERFHIGVVKHFADGSIQARTGYMREPYHTPFNGDAMYRGYPVQDREELAEVKHGEYREREDHDRVVPLREKVRKLFEVSRAGS